MRVRASLIVLLCVQLSISSAQLLPPDAVVSARLLDANLQDWAFKALLSPRTGVPYDAQVPTNLTGVKVSALRLRSGSLRTRGVHSYKEFDIPIGVIEKPYVERLVLVYQNLGNWSEQFYPLHGFSYLAPVLGLLAYSGVNLSASELPELDIRASKKKPVLVNFPHVETAPLGALPKCVYFDLHGSVKFGTLLNGNVCSTVKQGHFSIVVESYAPSPAPSSGEKNKKINEKNDDKFMLRIVVSCVVGGIVLLIVVLVVLVAGVRRHKKRTRVQKMERVAESNEIVDMTSIGDVRVPLAFGTRTRPMIEHDFYP